MAEIVNSPDEGNAREVDQPVSDIPEHLQGKSAQELADMYKSLERKLGEQSEELGSLRKLADTALLQQQAPAPAEDDVDFYTDPEGAVRRIVDGALRPILQERNQVRQQTAKQRLDSEHPGWQDTVKSQEFQEWVAKSKIRTSLFVEGNSGDYNAADELFSTWKGLSKSESATKEAESKAVQRDRKRRAATTEKGAAGIDPRKILSRADLRELKRTNPNRYQDLLPDIRKAYAEGRVR